MSLHTLLVLNEIRKMLEELDIEYKDMVEKALEGYRRDLEQIEQNESSILAKLLPGEEVPPLGAFTPKEIDDLKKEEK